MKRIFVVALVSGTLLLASSSRLPAPVSEIETPTPSAKHKSKSGKADDSEGSTKGKSKTNTQVKEITLDAAELGARHPYAGIWTGTVSVPLGSVEVRITVDDTQSVMTVIPLSKGTGNSFTSRATIGADGFSATFPAFNNPTGGWGHQSWSLKPDPNGKTAALRYKDPLGDITSILKRLK